MADDLERMKRELRLLKRYAILVSVLLVGVTVAAFTPIQQSDVLRARGLVIQDSLGNPRLVLGAPIGDVKGRERTDRTAGLLVLDEDGDDRINVGHPTIDPQVQGKVYERRVSGAGVVINDSEGDERTGWGVFENGTVVFGLDYHTREALTLVATDSAAAMSLKSPRKTMSGAASWSDRRARGGRTGTPPTLNGSASIWKVGCRSFRCRTRRELNTTYYSRSDRADHHQVGGGVN